MAKYSAFTKNYRQSANIEDRRGINNTVVDESPMTLRKMKPMENPFDFTKTPKSGGGGNTPSPRDPYTSEGPDGSTGSTLTKNDTSTTRKTSAEEAIRKTFQERN